MSYTTLQTVEDRREMKEKINNEKQEHIRMMHSKHQNLHKEIKKKYAGMIKESMSTNLQQKQKELLT